MSGVGGKRGGQVGTPNQQKGPTTGKGRGKGGGGRGSAKKTPSRRGKKAPQEVGKYTCMSYQLSSVWLIMWLIMWLVLTVESSGNDSEQETQAKASGRASRSCRGRGSRNRQGQPSGHDDEGYEGSDEEGAGKMGERRGSGAEAKSEAGSKWSPSVCVLPT